MKEQDDFYIGWKEEMPEKNSRFLKKVLIPLFIIIPLLVLVIVWLQKPFNQHQFEFGKTTAITGTYFNSPIPIIIADKGTLADSMSHDVMIVGYGKLGAKGIIEDIEQKNGRLHGKKITLEGTLIHGDGKTLLELTEGEASLKEVLTNPKVNAPVNSMKKEVALSGEIIDPKCYFGVMKPAEGKIHKSCAIRCISGGVPPVFRSKDAQDKYQYYLLVDESGQAINQQVLPFVAEQVSISGTTNQFASWDVLYIDVNDIKTE